jgi:hypothetical protein
VELHRPAKPLANSRPALSVPGRGFESLGKHQKFFSDYDLLPWDSAAG